MGFSQWIPLLMDWPYEFKARSGYHSCEPISYPGLVHICPNQPLLVMMTHTFNPSTQKAEAGGSLRV